jgi:hypothetical protein
MIALTGQSYRALVAQAVLMDLLDCRYARVLWVMW